MSTDSLIIIYRNQPAVRALFAWILENGVEDNRTTVERLMEECELSRRQAINALRAIADAGHGEFKVGRKGHPSRLEWAEDPQALAVWLTSGEFEVDDRDASEPEPQAGAEQPSSPPADGDDGPLELFPTEPPPSRPRRAASPDTPLIEHTYVLRPDLRLVFALPEDLTAREAQVLANWLEHLSFERD